MTLFIIFLLFIIEVVSYEEVYIFYSATCHTHTTVLDANLSIDRQILTSSERSPSPLPPYFSMRSAERLRNP